MKGVTDMMGYYEFEELRDLIVSFIKSDNMLLLREIREKLKEEETLGQITADLERHPEYIKVFDDKEQIQLIRNLTPKMSENYQLASQISLMLSYISEETVGLVLIGLDNNALNKIINAIEGHMKKVGKNSSDEKPSYLASDMGDIFALMKEKNKWRKLLQMCKKAKK